MFEFLFKYPASVFSRGTFVLLGSWPRWVLYTTMLGCGLLLAGWLISTGKFALQRQRPRALFIGLLQWATLAVLLLLLWEPAISVTALRAQQNVVAVVVDDSHSMALKEGEQTRQRQAIQLLNAGLLKNLQSRFQVRLYSLSSGVSRLKSLDELHADRDSTQINHGLSELAEESATLPIGALLLLSDGADNAGGIAAQTLDEIRRRRLPVNTIGFGHDKLDHDVEIESVDVPAKALPSSRLRARVTIHQNGFNGQRTRLVASAGGTVLANKEVTLQNSPEQSEPIEFNAGTAGVKTVEVKIDPLAGETNLNNNRLTRVLSVDRSKRRILYIEGEPRWEYKFIRRAAEEDPALQVVSMLRTTQNKVYRQGTANANELANGFPAKPEELFEYQAMIVGSVESAFFTTTQQQMIQDFADRRGGGILFLAGRWGLSDGGYNHPPFTELLPVVLPQRRTTFQRSFVAAELTEAGKRSEICRIEEDPAKTADHWEVLPYLANYQDAGTPKPGATVLANVNAGGKRLPLLITQNYGRGRSAVLATAGTWRWRMQQPATDTSQATFWKQLLRWAAEAAPTPVVTTTATPNLMDSGRIQLRAEVRDKNYIPVSDAEVSAHIIQPDGSPQTIPLRSEPMKPGIYAADWDAPLTGAYVAEVSANRGKDRLGSDVLPFHRENGVAENFHREQNRDLLQKLAEDTGGHYYTPQTANRLVDEISYSEAGITSREIKDLWNMPVVFLLLLALRASEWLLRRRWGVV
jgi:uncharacterized membrane protein